MGPLCAAKFIAWLPERLHHGRGAKHTWSVPHSCGCCGHAQRGEFLDGFRGDFAIKGAHKNHGPKAG